jgi:hypothetical protein
MKKILILAFAILTINNVRAFSQINSDTTVYLITCSPGTETYSIWGHSALRIVINHTQSDLVYNWGVFDFSTPHFAWKFANGRLNYMLGVYPYNLFLKDYLLENRSVYSQVINLEHVEKIRLLYLLEENLRPENVYYRYDFFYDDCSTRIRDLIEKILGSKLIYPPDEKRNAPTFRAELARYQLNFPWLKMGIDLLMGLQGERKTTFRDRMFLPDGLKDDLSQAVINRNRRMIPLLSQTVTVLDFPPPELKNPFYTTPIFIFTLLFILIIILSVQFRNSTIMNYIDIAIFLIFSVIALMMVFFNFFTDHQQMKMNMNIIWFNPFIIICLFCLIFNKPGVTWFRIVFYLAAVFVPLIIIIPNVINSAFVPVIFILLLRSSARGEFPWNPLSVRTVNME